MNNRQRSSRIPTKEALTQLLNTEPNEAQFHATVDQLDDFISAQLAGEDYEMLFPGVAAYLDSDPSLAEIYDRFYHLEVDARSDKLRRPASFPQPIDEEVESSETYFPKPDLSFLFQPVKSALTQISDSIPAWLYQLVPDKHIIPGLLDSNMMTPAIALRGGSDVDSYDNTPQQYIYYADSYCLFLNITPGIVAQTPAQLDGNIMNQENPDENYTGTVHLIQDQVRLQEITLDEFGFFGLDGVEADEYTLLLELDAHTIWIQGLVIA